MTPLHRELELLREQSLVYARELRSQRLKERETKKQLELYAHELRSMYRQDREPLLERKRMREEIADVIAGRQWSMVLQPIVDLTTGATSGYESLARFAPELGLTPDVVFSRAEDIGLGSELELAVADSALGLLADVPDHIYVSVNVSPATAQSATFSETLTFVPAERVVVEITEHARVDDYEALAASLDEFRDHHGRLAVDDAGAGFASLHHILKLAPDIVKLDICITRGVDRSRATRALAKALVTFSNEMGTTIVAEGIETKEQLAALQGLGVRYGQGYLLGRPAAPSAFLQAQA